MQSKRKPKRHPAQAALTSNATHASTPLRCVVEVATIDDAGILSIGGWAAALAEPLKIEFSTPRGTLGTASRGIARPDVRNAHPGFPQAGSSGFLFKTRNKSILTAMEVTMTLQDAAGASDTATIPLRLVSSEVIAASGNDIATPQSSAASTAGLGEDIKLHIDHPAIVAADTLQKIEGETTLLGWTVSNAGIDKIEVTVDDVNLGQAYYGILRPDVHSAFPTLKGAKTSGFALRIPRKILQDGTALVDITITDKQGGQLCKTYKLPVELRTPDFDTGFLKTKVSHAEHLLYEGILSRHGIRRVQTLVAIPVRNPAACKDLAQTLESIRCMNPRPDLITLLTPANAQLQSRLKAMVARLPASLSATIKVLRNNLGWKQCDALFPRGGSNKADYQLVQMECGDRLAADFLTRIALARLDADGIPDVVYGDSIRPSPVDSQPAPHFKPDWSPEYLLAFNYLGNSLAVTRSVAQKAYGSFGDFAFAGAYDRALATTEQARNIQHVHGILSSMRHAEPAHDELEALRNALKRRKVNATAGKTFFKSVYHVKRTLESTPKVSVIIPTIASNGHIKTCIDSIRQNSTYRNLEIIIVDNLKSARHKWSDWFAKNADVVIKCKEEFNWSRLNNLGRRHASGDYLLFLNDDTEVIKPDWLETMLAQAQRPGTGVVGPLLLYPDDKVQHAGMFLAGPEGARHSFRFLKSSEPGYFGLLQSTREVIGVTGACMLMRAATFDQLRGFDERHAIINNDLDFCLRVVESGLSIIYTPHAILYHHELASRAGLDEKYDAAGFQQRWGSAYLKGDPYYNPLLLTNCDDYSYDSEPLQEVCAGYPVYNADSVHNILMVKLDHIGDFITAQPAIHDLRRAFPKARLFLLTSPTVARIAREDPAIDEVLEFAFFHAKSGLGKVKMKEEELSQLRDTLAPYDFDIAIDLRKHLDSREVMQYTGARVLAGYDHNFSFPWLDVLLPWEGDPKCIQKSSHIAGDLRNLVSALVNAGQKNRATIPAQAHPVPASLKGIAKKMFSRPLVCIHPASGNVMRQWPADYFARLIKLLSRELDIHIAILGSPDEVKLAESVLADVKTATNVWSLVGKLKLNEVAAVLSRSKLFIGNNSGPQHIAAGLGVPTLAIHSSVVSSEEWGPLGETAVALRRQTYCGPCYLAKPEQCHRNLECLTLTTPEQVFQRCLKFL